MRELLKATLPIRVTILKLECEPQGPSLYLCVATECNQTYLQKSAGLFLFWLKKQAKKENLKG